MLLVVYSPTCDRSNTLCPFLRKNNVKKKCQILESKTHYRKGAGVYGIRYSTPDDVFLEAHPHLVVPGKCITRFRRLITNISRDGSKGRAKATP